MINKSDQNTKKAKVVKHILENHLKLSKTNKTKSVFTSSALKQINIDIIWKNIQLIYLEKEKSGELDKNRNNQNLFWLKKIIEEEYFYLLYKNGELNKRIIKWENKLIENPRKIALDIIKKLKPKAGFE